LIILFQHNNLKSIEWVSIRRELSKALQKVDDSLVAEGQAPGAIRPALKL
jgi:large subunit ribosomal protein L10